MTAPCPHRGGAPVGYVAELGPVEAGAVMCLRLWCDGAAAQDRVRGDLDAVLGSGDGAAATAALARICDLCTRHGRRPLMRHHVACACLGADESCFANFVAAAAEGEREDAMLMATLMVRADMAPGLVSLAEAFGHALRRMARPPGVPAPTQTIH